MNENLDLTKILEGCPKGVNFYHTVYGTVLFDSIDLDSEYPIRFIVGKKAINNITKSGLAISDYKGECVLFPSKYQRDWSKFVRFWDKSKVKKFDPKTLQPFDKVLVRDINTSDWYVDFFSNFNSQGEFICTGGCHWIMGIPYNEDTKHLVGTTKDCPEYYKWWEK